jgi:hypothetical protein
MGVPGDGRSRASLAQEKLSILAATCAGTEETPR